MPHGPATDIPDKVYFKIGEVAELVGVEAHVLRYWEREVGAIRPEKSRSNQRRYRRRDVDLFRTHKRLLYDEKFTLAGARKRLLSVVIEAPAVVDAPACRDTQAAQRIERLRCGLKDLLEFVSRE